MQIQSSSKITERRLKMLFWGSWGTRKTETILRYFPDVLIIDTEGNIDQVVGHPDIPEFLYDQTKDVHEIIKIMDDVAAKKIKFADGRLVRTLAVDTASVLWQVRQEVGAQAAEKRALRYNKSADEATMTPLDWVTAKRPLKRLQTRMANMPIPFLIMTAREKVKYAEGAGKDPVQVGVEADVMKGLQYDVNLSLRFGNDETGWFGQVDKVQGVLSSKLPVGGIMRTFPSEYLISYASQIFRPGTLLDDSDVAAENLKTEEAEEAKKIERTQTNFIKWANTAHGLDGKQVGAALTAAGFKAFDATRWDEMVAAVSSAVN